MTLNVRGLARFYEYQETLFKFNLQYLFLVGLWPSEDMSTIKRVLYKTYEITLTVFSVILIIITGIGLYQTRDNITIFLTNFDKSLAAYNFIAKAMVFLINRDKMRALINEIENSGDKLSDEKKELLAKYVIFMSTLTLSIIASFTGLALLKGETTIEAWMPFDPLKSQMNLIIACQIIAICFVPCALRAFAMKGLVCSIIVYLCDQLVKLQDDIKMLEYSKQREMDMRMKFKRIVKNHARLMGYSKSMEMIFKEYFLIQNLAVSVEVCLNAIMMTVAGVKHISLLITFLVYLFCALLNAYIYCYLGNELMTKSEGIAYAAYESTWTSWPVDMQKDLLILIMAAQRPFKLSAGGIAVLSFRTFSQTLSNGYSIFAVLNDVVN